MARRWAILNASWAYTRAPPFPQPRVPTPAVQQWGGLGPLHLERHLVSSTYFLTDVQPDPTCPQKGSALACHKAVSPFQGHAAPAPTTLSKSPWNAGGLMGSGHAKSPAGSTTPRHGQGHHAGWAGASGGAWGAGPGKAEGLSGCSDHTLKPRGPGSPCELGHQWAPDHSAVTASGRTPSPLALRPPASPPILSSSTGRFKSFTQGFLEPSPTGGAPGEQQ